MFPGDRRSSRYRSGSHHSSANPMGMNGHDVRSSRGAASMTSGRGPSGQAHMGVRASAAADLDGGPPIDHRAFVRGGSRRPSQATPAGESRRPSRGPSGAPPPYTPGGFGGFGDQDFVKVGDRPGSRAAQAFVGPAGSSRRPSAAMMGAPHGSRSAIMAPPGSHAAMVPPQGSRASARPPPPPDNFGGVYADGENQYEHQAHQGSRRPPPGAGHMPSGGGGGGGSRGGPYRSQAFNNLMSEWYGTAEDPGLGRQWGDRGAGDWDRYFGR
ncbi:hypothetical protein EK21DRAFT_94702 [Setomelanomma holmii]|uniref:Uncharacterized protein n=1 Tax=Setomelanomma holmii TaxID=210430 RepID=A0A9P4GVI8_9PLEO|nr:hypothetical protein EK21DRAFT_94702 [Setomelanomma holmii]